MAGIKITDLSALSVAESTDYLCIVDVSDTSQSPAGTTKKIEVGNFASSGTWIPVFSNVGNAASNASLEKAQYSRVGNIVTCTIHGTIDLDFSTVENGRLDFTYPFTPSTPNAIGTCALNSGAVETRGFVTENKIAFQSSSTSVLSGLKFLAIFQYEID